MGHGQNSLAPVIKPAIKVTLMAEQLHEVVCSVGVT